MVQFFFEGYRIQCAVAECPEWLLRLFFGMVPLRQSRQELWGLRACVKISPGGGASVQATAARLKPSQLEDHDALDGMLRKLRRTK